MRRFADRHAAALAGAVAAIAALCLLPQFVLNPGLSQDLYIYRAGATLALAGGSPYDRAALYEMIAARFPDQPLLIQNHGFFLAPAGVALFAPFAPLPWGVAKTTWFVLSYTLAGLGAWQIVPLAGPAARARFADWWRPALVAAALWDPLLFIGTAVGQTAAVMAGCLMLGAVQLKRGRGWASACLWAVLFAKPHLALPLIPLAAYLGGWRQALRVALAAGLLTLIGVALCGGPGVVPAFLRHLADSHKAVEFNKVSWNPQLLSWNRPVYALGLAEIELGAKGVLIGYAAAALLIAARVRLAGARPTPAWALAAAVTAAAECCQLLASEGLLLMGVLPHLLDTLAARRRLAAAWLVAGLVLKSVPFELAGWASDWEFWSPTQTMAIQSARGFGVLVLSSGLLVTGWRAGGELAPPDRSRG